MAKRKLLRPGITMLKRGRKYILNSNHRWQKVKLMLPGKNKLVRRGYEMRVRRAKAKQLINELAHDPYLKGVPKIKKQIQLDKDLKAVKVRKRFLKKMERTFGENFDIEGAKRLYNPSKNRKAIQLKFGGL